MKIAYITKTPWGENSPGFVFSYFQCKGFAEYGLNSSLLMKIAKSNIDDQKRIDKNLIKNHNVKLFKDNFGFIKSNEINAFAEIRDIVAKRPDEEVQIEFLRNELVLKRTITLGSKKDGKNVNGFGASKFIALLGIVDMFLPNVKTAWFEMYFFLA